MTRSQLMKTWLRVESVYTLGYLGTPGGTTYRIEIKEEGTGHGHIEFWPMM